LSTLPLEENARSTKQAVETLKSINPEVIIDGEIGDIGSGTEIHVEVASPGRALSTPEEARQFVTETKVDVLAPAVGNSHGVRKSMVTGKERKHLAIERIREIKSATCVSRRSVPGSISSTSTRNCVWRGNRSGAARG
jgi:fructose-bisphosphate aldolase class II